MGPLTEKFESDGNRSFRDLAGNLITDPRFSGARADQNTIDLAGISSFVGEPHGISTTQQPGGGYRSSEAYASNIYAYQQVTNESWYYLWKERVFTGFNSLSRIPVGSIGQDEFAPGTALARPFSKRLGAIAGYQVNNVSVFRFGSTVYYLDFAGRVARRILVADGISGVGGVNPATDADILQGLAAVALADRLVLVDRTGKVLATLPYDHDMERWGALSVGVKAAKGPLYLQYGPSRWIPWPQQRTMPSYLEQFDLRGHLLKSYVLPPLEQSSGPRTWEQWTTECLRTPAYLYGNLVYEEIGARLGFRHLAGALHQELVDGWGYTKDVGIRLTVLSFLLALVTLLGARCSDFTWRQAWNWAGFVLAFNLAGLIVFRLVADWPVRIKCPQCGRPRRVDEATCPHCAAAWPKPPRDGTEIIDELERAPREPGLPVV